MTKKPLTPKQTEALDRDNDGKAGGSPPKDRPLAEFTSSDDITHDAPAFTPEEAVANWDNSALEPPREEDYGPEDAPPMDLIFEDAEPESDYGPFNIAEVSAVCLFYRNDDDGPYAAIMTQVNAEARTVHLASFARTSGFVSAELDVPHRDHREGNGRFWTWNY